MSPPTPPPVKPPPGPDERVYWVSTDGKVSGPYSLTEMRSKFYNLEFPGLPLCLRDGERDWIPVQHCCRDNYYPTQQGASLPVNTSRAAFILLGVFFGALGIHNFYAGFVGRGMCQLLITILLGVLVIGPVISIVWALLEVIVVTTDAHGRRMH